MLDIRHWSIYWDYIVHVYIYISYTTSCYYESMLWYNKNIALTIIYFSYKQGSDYLTTELLASVFVNMQMSICWT